MPFHQALPDLRFTGVRPGTRRHSGRRKPESSLPNRRVGKHPISPVRMGVYNYRRFYTSFPQFLMDSAIKTDSAIKVGYIFEHAPGVFTEILAVRPVQDSGQPPLWDLCIDSHVGFSARQFSRNLFAIYGGGNSIPVTVIEAYPWESMYNRTRITVHIIDSDDADD